MGKNKDLKVMLDIWCSISKFKSQFTGAFSKITKHDFEYNVGKSTTTFQLMFSVAKTDWIKLKTPGFGLVLRKIFV